LNSNRSFSIQVITRYHAASVAKIKSDMAQGIDVSDADKKLAKQDGVW
jgi:hypothetical protein